MKMIKYKTFEEYINVLYKEKIKKELELYLIKSEKYINSGNVYNFTNCQVKKINVNKIIYTKSQLDKLEFNVIFSAIYNLMDKTFQYKENRHGNFVVSMRGSFKTGFDFKEDYVDIDETDNHQRYTNGLVPVISTDEFDKYAKKFLKVLYPEALISPIKINVDTIIERLGLEYYYSPLEDGILGKIFFSKEKVLVYKNGSILDGSAQYKTILPGTILIDHYNSIKRGECSTRNTLIHEAIHWFFHRNYFELRQYLDNEKNCMVCYRAEQIYDNEDIGWMEAQARRLAPRILMPKETSEIKLKDIFTKILAESKSNNFTVNDLEKIVREFAIFFGVSIQSAKIRIKELGYTQFDGVFNYDHNGKKLEKFISPHNLLNVNQSFICDETSYKKLLKENILVRKSIADKKLIYINHMIIANNLKYIKNNKLTVYALEHPEECALIFDTIPNVEIVRNTNGKLVSLASASGSKNNKLEVLNSQYTKVLAFADINYKHYERHKSLLPNDLSGTIKYHYEKCKENGKFFNTIDFALEADVSDSSIRSYMKNKKPKNRIRVLKIGLALELSTPYLLDMLNKYDEHKININVENILFNTIVFSFGENRTSLEIVYYELKKNNQESILEMSNTWLINHGIID